MLLLFPTCHQFNRRDFNHAWAEIQMFNNVAHGSISDPHIVLWNIHILAHDEGITFETEMSERPKDQLQECGLISIISLLISLYINEIIICRPCRHRDVSKFPCLPLPSSPVGFRDSPRENGESREAAGEHGKSVNFEFSKKCCKVLDFMNSYYEYHSRMWTMECIDKGFIDSSVNNVVPIYK